MTYMENLFILMASFFGMPLFWRYECKMGQAQGRQRATALREGTTLLTHFVPNTKSVTVLCMVRVGSRDEIKGLYGASHHLEHMLFKGTSSFPSSKAITSVLDSIGASYNASTSYDYTSYYITVPSEHTETAFVVLSEMLRFPLLSSKELARERWVVAEEIHRKHDSPSSHVLDLAQEQVFGGNSLGRSIAGSVEDVKNHNAEQVRRFWAQYYVPSRMAVVVCGGHPECESAAGFLGLSRKFAQYYMEGPGAPPQGRLRRKLRGMLRRRIASLRGQPPLATEHKPFFVSQGHPQLRCYHKDTDQCHTVIAFPTPFGASDPQTRVVKLICDMLGGYMSSRLWAAIRERKGWAYNVSMMCDFFQETGAIYVHMGLKTRGPDGKEDPSITREALVTALGEIERFEPSEAELAMARGHQRGQLAMLAERSSWLSNYYANQWLYGKPIENVDQEREAIAGIRLREVRSLARRLLRPERCTLCCISRTPHTREALERVATEKGVSCRMVSPAAGWSESSDGLSAAS